jgi:hypothetical protein
MNALFFGVALQIICYLVWAFDVFGGLMVYPYGDVAALTGDGGIFNLDVYNTLIGIGGGIAIGLAGLLLKQGVYAVFAMLLWAIGCITNVINSFFLAIPNTIASFIPESTNPLPGQVHPFTVVIGIIFAVAAWLYLFGLVIQREP